MTDTREPRFGDSRLPERFWSKAQPVTETGCWLWLAQLNDGGYGIIHRDGPFRAHRWAYEALVAPIPNGLQLDHLCRERSCCNPLHLEPVTNYENMLRGESLPAQRARKTHCDRGHELSEDNLYRWATHRYCKRCVRDGQKARYVARPRVTKTHCKHGHPLSGDNLYAYKGSRKCKTCIAAAVRRLRSKTWPT